MKKLFISMFATALLSTGCGSDDPAVDAPGATTYTLALTNAQETPACAAEAAATGAGTVTISADNATITVTGLSATGLTAAATNAHIHSGATGVAGGVAIPLGATLPLTASFTATNFTPVTGGPQTFAELITAMKAGNTYVNVHTAACATGAIRDQIN